MTEVRTDWAVLGGGDKFAGTSGERTELGLVCAFGGKRRKKGILGVFVGEAAVGHYGRIQSGEESGIEGLWDEVDICSVGQAVSSQ